MKIAITASNRTTLLICLLSVTSWQLPAQTQTDAPSAASRPQAASTAQHGINPATDCAPFLHLPKKYKIKVTLLSIQSPSHPGYGSGHEILLNKIAVLMGQNPTDEFIGGDSINKRFIGGDVILDSGDVMIVQSNGPICPLSLQAPAPPVPFQVIATPSQKITQPGMSLPKEGFPTSEWPSGPYRIYRIHYSIAPKDVQLYSLYEWQPPTFWQSPGFLWSGSPVWGFLWGGSQILDLGDINNSPNTVCVGTLEFTTVLYGKNGSIVNSTDASLSIDTTLSTAKKMLQSGVGFDQTIAVPASGTYRLRAVVTDPASKRGSESELTLDAANPKRVETPPVRPTPTGE